MALIDELKQHRAEMDEKYHRAIADGGYYCGRLNDLDLAIAALEAPAQPVHPDAELRSVPGAEEEVRDQSFEDKTFLEQVDETLRGLNMVRAAFDPLNLTADEIRRIGEAEDAVDATLSVPDADLTVADLDKLEGEPGGGVYAEPEIPEGFTKWESGYCPFDIGTELEVLSRKCGSWHVTIKPEAPLLWEHEGHDLDIIAYRILEAPAPEQPASVEIEPVLDATILPQVTPDEVPPTAEVIHTDDGRKRFALFGGQTHEVVSGSGNPDADFWANVLHPKPKEDA